MKNIVVAVLLSTLSASALADEPTLAQRTALHRMYDMSR